MKHQPVRRGQTTTPGTTCPTLFDKCVGSLTSPADCVTLKMQETGPTVIPSRRGDDNTPGILMLLKAELIYSLVSHFRLEVRLQIVPI